MPIQDVSTPMLNVFGNGMSTGFQTAGNIQQINQANDLANQGAALNNDINSQKYNDEVLNQPLNAANRQLGIAKANDSIDLINQGIPQQQAKANLASTLASIDATTLSTQEKRKLAIGSTAEQMDNTLGEQVTIPLPQLQQYRSQWKEITGKDLPTDPAEARATIKTYGDWQRNDGAALMKQAEMKSKENIAKIGADSRERIADSNNDQKIQAAILKGQQAAKDPKKIEESITAYQNKKARGEATTPDEDEAFRINVALYAQAHAAQSTGAKIGGLETGPTPAEATVQGIVSKNAPATTTPTTPAPKISEGTKKVIGGVNYIYTKGKWMTSK